MHDKETEQILLQKALVDGRVENPFKIYIIIPKKELLY